MALKDIGKLVCNLSKSKQKEFKEQLRETLNDQRTYFMMGGSDYVRVPQHDLYRIKKNLYKTLFLGSKNFVKPKNDFADYIKENKSCSLPHNGLKSYGFGKV
ncbi:MAG: hypothetical protein ABEI74_01945 [Candidatus Pacearchaeota archaeon]